MGERKRERADNRAAFAALITAAVMIAQQVGSKATRDALFLSSFAPEDLPRVVIAAAAASVVAVLGASRAYAAFGPARVVPFAFGVSGVLYVVEWIFAETMPRPVAVVLYLHTAIFGALVISGFWSVINERFDPYTAKKVVSRIGSGATFGGVAGGLLAERVGALLDANAMLLALGILNAIAAVGVSQIRLARRPSHLPESTLGALAVLRRAPYLRALAGLVLLTAVSAQLLDYAFKAEAAAHFEQGSSELLSFFALFHVVAAVLSLVLQFGLAKSVLERFGVAGGAASLPAVVLVTAAISAGVTQLATVVIARASELVLANSIFRSGYELLYTPVAPEKKRPTKALIDVAINRLGDATGSTVVLIAIALVPMGLTHSVVLGLAAFTALVTLVIARRLHRGYLAQLEESLRSGSPKGAEAALLQAATLQTLSTLGLDRETLFEQLAAHQSWSDRASVAPSSDDGTASAPLPPDGIDAPADDPVHEAATVLRSGGVSEIRRTLADGPLDVRLAPFAIALLARRDVYHEAVKALRTVVDDVIEPLVDALVDPDQPFAIRRRIPRILAVSDRQSAHEGLARGLHDDRFEVRYRCALALARIAARLPRAWMPGREEVHERVKYELDFGRKVWDSRRLLDEDSEDDDHLLDAKEDRDKVHKSVEHVFTLLSLAYEATPVRLSLLAYASDDQALRGTALEYLDTVLPDDIRDALFPMLDVRMEIGQRRDRKAIVADLVRSMHAMDAGALRDAIEAETGKD